MEIDDCVYGNMFFRALISEFILKSFTPDLVTLFF